MMRGMIIINAWRSEVKASIRKLHLFYILWDVFLDMFELITLGINSSYIFLLAEILIIAFATFVCYLCCLIHAEMLTSSTHIHYLSSEY
jgi:hypothetical protein